jgi:hypothetical protein
MAQNHLRFFPHGTENFLASQARPDSIAIGAVV